MKERNGEPATSGWLPASPTREERQVMDSLAIPVPPQREAACGYESAARWVAWYWERAGDELAWTDGWQSVCGAPWEAWLLDTRHRSVRPALAAYELGSSDTAARHWSGGCGRRRRARSPSPQCPYRSA